MRHKLTAEEYEKIEQIVDCALSVSNKTEAKRYIQQLHYLGSDLSSAVNNILHELITSTDRASGQVRDKARLEYFAKMDLYKLNDFVEEDIS